MCADMVLVCGDASKPLARRICPLAREICPLARQICPLAREICPLAREICPYVLHPVKSARWAGKSGGFSWWAPAGVTWAPEGSGQGDVRRPGTTMQKGRGGFPVGLRRVSQMTKLCAAILSPCSCSGMYTRVRSVAHLALCSCNPSATVLARFGMLVKHGFTLPLKSRVMLAAACTNGRCRWCPGPE